MSEKEEREEKEEKITTPSAVRKILKRFNISSERSMGQHFLVDEGVLNTLMSAADLAADDRVIEIGPGLGALTGAVLEEVPQGELLAVEKDRRLYDILNELFGARENLELICEDALEVDWDLLLGEKGYSHNDYTLMANLPYYITSPLIRKFLEIDLAPDQMILMVQKAVAERITAAPGNKSYGILSVAVQFYCYPEIIDFVPPQSFLPAPEVKSAIIRLKLSRSPRFKPESRETFFAVLRAMFQQRRKMLRNSLSQAAEMDLSKEETKKALAEAGIESSLRGEKLFISEIVELSDAVSKITAGNGD